MYIAIVLSFSFSLKFLFLFLFLLRHGRNLHSRKRRTHLGSSYDNDAGQIVRMRVCIHTYSL